MMNCIVCGSDNTRLLEKNLCGYVEGTFFDIFECNICRSQFIDVSKVDRSIYDLIYSDVDTPGYERYYEYAKKVKSLDNPLEFLGKSEEMYYAVYNHLKGKSGLSILEIGCGYGYQTYSINKAGFNVKGIDIAGNAIEFALKNFGDYYQHIDLAELTQDNKYDIVISTEVIEHLDDIRGFILRCSELLADNGEILLTTPDRDYSKNVVWHTDMPPVHASWISYKGLKILAESLNLEIQKIDLSKYREHYNQLARYLINQKQRTAEPIIKQDGTAYSTGPAGPGKLAKGLIYSKPIFKLSNFIYRMLGLNHPILAVLLKKKQ